MSLTGETISSAEREKVEYNKSCMRDCNQNRLRLIKPSSPNSSSNADARSPSTIAQEHNPFATPQVPNRFERHETTSRLEHYECASSISSRQSSRPRIIDATSDQQSSTSTDWRRPEKSPPSMVHHYLQPAAAAAQQSNNMISRPDDCESIVMQRPDPKRFAAANHTFLYLFALLLLASIASNQLDNDGQSSDRHFTVRLGFMSAVECSSSAFVLRDQKVLALSSITHNATTVGSSGAKKSNINSSSGKPVHVKAPAGKVPVNNGRRNLAKFVQPSQLTDSTADQLGQELSAGAESSAGLQISITPRVNKFTKKFDIHWSRYMYDENVYEQLESNIPLDESTDIIRKSWQTGHTGAAAAAAAAAEGRTGRIKRADQEVPANKPTVAGFNRQQQLRDFLARSRQETNPISDLLIEATLSISPVKASDNATYYCTATDGLIDQNRARIDLVALARPVVQLDRVLPARDSKSAIIYWLIVSDGNTPIKKTILMVRNDTTTNGSNNRSSWTRHQQHDVDQQQQQLDGHLMNPVQFSSSVVTDSDFHQWQRIDIPNDGLSSLTASASEMFDGIGNQEPTTGNQYNQAEAEAAAGTADSNSDDSVVRADVDVTSTSMQIPPSTPVGATTDYQYTSRSKWLRHNRFNRRQRSYTINSLLPGVTYNFRLAAINDMGQSNWTYLTATMPNEIPAQISEVFLLSRSNDSLAIGWRRPSYDGAKTVRYEMQLFDLNRTLTLDANTNTSVGSSGSGGGGGSSGSPRTNFMYIFVNLNPGTDYHFHVRACSKAGCSSFSSPKLLASTLDGESDEPTDVELSCHWESGNVSVTWLPPVNTRGHLLNYSVSFDSYARYQNQTGQWTVDEWRSTMETTDNHTISLETRGILMPNTNYSVRVCANNRSKHCGRLSSLSPRTQCSTPPELPNELPVGVRLSSKSFQLNNSQEESNQKSPVESLVLELPAFSQRNGTIDCIQIVLIRLPKSYSSSSSATNRAATSTSSLAPFLPSEPSDIKLSPFSEVMPTASRPASDNKLTNDPSSVVDINEKAVAYLAEELDFANSVWSPTTEQTTNEQQSQQIVLGDGSQQICRSLPRNSNANGSAGRFKQVFDGPLSPQTYYTGFIKLVLVRPSNKWLNYRQRTARRSVDGVDIVTKYSHYFAPVKTGDSLIEVPMPTSDDTSNSNTNDRVVVSPFANRFGASQIDFQDFANRLGSNFKLGMSKLYNSTSNFVANNQRIDAIGNYIRHSSPTMQVIQIGIIVLVSSLFFLLVIYVLHLPAAMSRKRKRRLKRKLQHHQQQQATTTTGSSNPEKTASSYMVQAAVVPSNAVNGLDGQSNAQTNEHPYGSARPSVQELASSIGYQQVDSIQQQQQQQQQAYGYGTVVRSHLDNQCPIHSSPSSRSQQQQVVDDQSMLNRRPSVHLCHQQQLGNGEQPPVAYQTVADHGPKPVVAAHGHHHHHHYHQYTANQQQQQQQFTNQELSRQEQYDRNCRTTRRVHASSNGGNQLENVPNDLNSAGKTFTLSHHSSILALARKINKSIPLRLFGAVFECRLRNGWLKEEYEQLPRQQLSIPDMIEQQQQQQQQHNGYQTNSKQTPPSSLNLRLRPQLIVSRNDTVSALISGDEKFDASLVKLNLVDGVEKKIICAKSPLDANSVWDFWRLIYEQEVSTLVMLTQTEDPSTGEPRCAQYWPTNDNEETTILSPGNEYVQKSNILPAKFKIRLETLNDDESREADDFKVSRLTLVVMATKPSEYEQNDDTGSCHKQQVATNKGSDNNASNNKGDDDTIETADEDDDEDRKRLEAMSEDELVIVERNILHLQFCYWRTSSINNQMRLIKFIEMANERHSSNQQQESPTTGDGPPMGGGPMLVHCFNGLGRSGLFAAMSFIIDDLAAKLSYEQQQQQQEHHQLQKINIFQLVSRLRSQREMLVSPYRFYELLYQLTSNCIPQAPQSQLQQASVGGRQLTTR